MENKMEDFELTKKPDTGIFDRRFPAMFDDSIYDPTKMTIIQGTDGVLDDLFSYQVYNKLKNNWRGAVAPVDMQDGMIYSDTDDGKLHHRHGAALEEVLQLTRSADVSPYFANLYLAEYIYHTGDLDTFIRLKTDQIILRAGNVIFINMLEAATNYLQLLDGLNFIGDTLNAKMTVGLTINQAGNDDEILAFKSEGDVAHGITDWAETDTYGMIKKYVPDDGGVALYGFGEDKYGIAFIAGYTVDNTTKSTAGEAPIVLNVYKKSGTGWGAQGADANIVVMKTAGSARWILDEDGDTWQPGEITCASLALLALGASTELTIAGDAITVTKSYHTVDGQGDAHDDLSTINGGVDGQILVLKQENIARQITVKDNIGNIELEGSVDMALDALLKKLYLFYDGTLTKWVEFARFNGV